MFVPPLPGDHPFPLWPPLLATEGPGERSAHHAMHFIFALEGSLRVRSAGGWNEAPGLLSAPDQDALAWLKLQSAAGAIVSGGPLSGAAFGVGFSDAAHMTRSFRRMLGVKPTELQTRVATASGT